MLEPTLHTSLHLLLISKVLCLLLLLLYFAKTEAAIDQNAQNEGRLVLPETTDLSDFQQVCSRSKSKPLCPPGSQFSTFGFASFILIAVQTVINVISNNNSNNNNNNNNNNDNNNNDNNLNINENDATT